MVAEPTVVQLLLLLLLLLAMHLPLGEGTFLRVDSATVRQGLGGAGSQFGYRVAVLPDHSSGGGGVKTFHLLVSDPKAVNRVTGHSSGAVFRCPIRASDFNTTAPICRDAELAFDFKKPAIDPGVVLNLTQFGASMSTLPSGQFVICAPGYNFVTWSNQTATPGLCAYWQSVGSEPVWLEKLLPFLSSDPMDRMFSNCMGGFQAELLPSAGGGGDPQLVVSGPFCMQRRLAVISPPASGRNQPVAFENINAHDYMGFSLASGRENATFVYATSPHMNVFNDGITLMARVQMTAAGGKTAQRIFTRSSTEIYARIYRSFNFIGYSSAIVQASDNGISSTAAVLGAPFESDASDANKGCFYIVPMSTDNVKSALSIDDSPVHYCGTDPGGRLGTSVVNIGDVNHDGSEDFAVGCPGCGVNQTGAIYLFLGLSSYRTGSGSRLARRLEPFEIVLAERVSPELSGLGWSLALAGDLDGNGAGELVASAVASGHVTVLPGRMLLNTVIDLSYSNTGEHLSDLPISKFAHAVDQEIVLTITMKAAAEFDLTRYRFNLALRLLEFAEEEQSKRFDIEAVSHPQQPGHDWWQLERTNDASNSAKFQLRFKLKLLSNIRRHIPASTLLRDFQLLMQWRMLNRTVPVGSNFPFPAILYNNKVYSGEEIEVKVKLFGFMTSVCRDDSYCQPNGNMRLTLLNESSLTLSSFDEPITVALQVKKVNPKAYYGGAAIKMNLTQGVQVIGVDIMQKDQNVSKASYWRDQQEALITEPYPGVQRDFMTGERSGSLIAFVHFKFDGRHSSYLLNFNLTNIMAKEGYQAYVTNDTKPMDNIVSMVISFNTSLTLTLLSKKDDFTVIDPREASDEKALLSLKGLADGNKIGPALQHTYELRSITKPVIPVQGLSLTLRLPFVTASNKLLLYFPRSAIGSGPVQLPGSPFLSDSAEGIAGNGESECLAVETDLAKLRFKPDVILLSKKQRGNASTRAKRDAAIAGQDARGFADGLTPNPLDSQNASASMATSDSATLPGGRNVETEPVFDCEKPYLAPFEFRCITFRCDVRTMSHNGSSGAADKVFLHVHARIWSPTFFAAHLNTFTVKSDAALVWQNSTGFMSIDRTDNASAEQKFLFVNFKPPIVSEIPWGFVVLAVFIGIWLLMLCILLMWYCNFFKRNKLNYSAVAQEEPATGLVDDFYR